MSQSCRAVVYSPVEVIEKGRESWALTPRKQTLGLVAVTSERRKVDLAIDAIVREGLVCNKLGCKAQNEQHNSRRQLSAVTVVRQESLGKPAARCGKEAIICFRLPKRNCSRRAQVHTAVASFTFLSLHNHTSCFTNSLA